MDHSTGIGLWQVVAVVVYAAIIVLPFWKITAKAGYNSWLSLLVIIPIVNLIYIYFLAFSNWPSFRNDIQR